MDYLEVSFTAYIDIEIVGTRGNTIKYIQEALQHPDYVIEWYEIDNDESLGSGKGVRIHFYDENDARNAAIALRSYIIT